MKIEEYRTSKYQYKTYWRIPELIITYGFEKKNLNPNTELAFLNGIKRKQHMEKK